MSTIYLCSAIGTPLDPQDGLCVEGLARHLDHQAGAGISGILVAGTMGAMPLLTSQTYHQLVHKAVELWAGRGELLVGVGDLSFARTRERVALVNELDVDGAVVLSPFFLPYSQADLVAYFQELADESSVPLYLYDLPQRTGVALAIETVQRLAQHPNIAGIKCSGELGHTRRLIDSLAGANFRVIVAQAPLLDMLLRHGVREHVDGVYCLVPELVRKIADAATEKDWQSSARHTQKLNGLLSMLGKYGVFPAMTALLNHQGVPGNFAPRPHRPLSPEACEQLLSEPHVRAASALS